MRSYRLLVFVFSLLALGLWSADPGVAQVKDAAYKPGSSLSPKAAPGENTASAKEASQRATPVFPGLAEVVPYEAELTKEAAKVKERIAAAWNTAELNAQINDCEVGHKKMKELIAVMGNPDGWDLGRLNDARVLVLRDRKQSEALVAIISTKLTDLDSIREEWEKKLTFWQKWRRSLEAAKVELPADTFDKVQASTSTILGNVANTAKLLIGIQQKASKLLEENLEVSKPLEAAQSKLRGETFKQIEPSFINEDFFAQFNSSLRSAAFENMANALKAEGDFLIKSAWGILFRVLVILAVGFLARAHRNRTYAVGEAGHLLDHPWALGVFVAELIFVVTSHGSSSLGRHLAFLLFSLSGWVLLPNIWKDRHGRFILLFLTALITGSGIARLISLPPPIYRLVSAFFLLAGAVFFWTLACRRRRLLGGRSSLFAAGCVLGSFIMASAFISQASGLVNLSDRIVSLSSGTFLLAMASFLTLSISNFFIDETLHHPLIAQYRLISQFGTELGILLKRIFNLAIYCLSFLQLFCIWGVYDSTGQAAEEVFRYRFSFGSLSLSIGLIATALLVIYFSRSISWFVRALLDTEVFPRKNVDRGAGEAINKLVHYSCVLVGFLIGLNVIGIDVKNFVVLGGALGIGVGFGLQNIVNNFISGLILLFERPVRVADIVMVGNEKGKVQKIGLRSTIVETLDRSELIVPNSNFISQNVTNWTLSSSVARLKIPVRVDCESDMELVATVLREAAKTNPGVMVDPAPVALLVRLAESGLDFELHVWLADVREELLARSEITQQIAKRFRSLGIEVAFPQMGLHLRSIREEAGKIAGVDPETQVFKVKV